MAYPPRLRGYHRVRPGWLGSTRFWTFVVRATNSLRIRSSNRIEHLCVFTGILQGWPVVTVWGVFEHDFECSYLLSLWATKALAEQELERLGRPQYTIPGISIEELEVKGGRS